MDKRDWIIIGLSLQLTLMGFGLTKMAYQWGYDKGRLAELASWNEDGDGYCLADKPSHKGQCWADIKAKGDKHK